MKLLLGTLSACIPALCLSMNREIEKNLSEYFETKNILSYTTSPNNNYIFLGIKDEGSYLFNCSTKKKKFLCKETKTACNFNEDSSKLAFFTYQTPIESPYAKAQDKLVVYDVNKDAFYKELLKKKPTKHLLFANKDIIVTSDDEKTYDIWDTEKTTTTEVKLSGKNQYPCNSCKQHENYVHFMVPTEQECTIYKRKTEEIFYLHKKGAGIFFIVDPQEKYALFITNNNIAALYETTSFDCLATIRFFNTKLNPLATFSPKENYVISYSIEAQKLKVYDIKNNSCTFMSDFKPEVGSIHYYNNNSIIFCSSTDDITIYDYVNQKKAILHAQEEIERYTIQSDILTIVTASSQQIIYLKNIVFSGKFFNEEEVFLESHLKKESVLADQFYGFDGKLHSFKLESEQNSYCILA